MLQSYHRLAPQDDSVSPVLLGPIWSLNWVELGWGIGLDKIPVSLKNKPIAVVAPMTSTTAISMIFNSWWRASGPRELLTCSASLALVSDPSLNVLFLIFGKVGSGKSCGYCGRFVCSNEISFKYNILVNGTSKAKLISHNCGHRPNKAWTVKCLHGMYIYNVIHIM